MRLFIAATIALITLATPAAAQRLDARRDSGGTDEGRAHCRFTAYPDLKLEHQTDGSAPFALWAGDARETDYTAQRTFSLLVAFAPGDAGAVFANVPLLSVRTEHDAFPRMIASARVLVDGKDAGVSLRLEGTMRMDPGSRNTLRLVPAESDGIRLAALLLAGRAAQLDLLDDQGAAVRSYHWDVRRLRDAPLVLAQAEWKCGDAIYR